MNRRSALLFIAIFTMLFSHVGAGSVVLVYPSENDVIANKSILGTLTSEGIVVPSKFALESQGKCLAGIPDQALRKTSLIRLDASLDVAILGWGDEVKDPKIQAAFKTRSDAYVKFLPVDLSSGMEAGAMAAVPSRATPSAPFFIRINDVYVDTMTVIELPIQAKKSEFKLEVIRGPGNPVWRVNVELTSNPATVSFWKKGKEKTLIHVPEKKFSYAQQSMFSSLHSGESFTLPIEVYFIKSESYEWTIKLKSKEGSLEKKFSVIFKENVNLERSDHDSKKG